MSDGPLRIAMVGTFDIENFGDLLFPVLAEHELRRRVPDVELVPFGYRPMSASEWAYEVRSLGDLPAEIDGFDLLLVGGGQIVHNNTPVAHGYHPASTDVHDPLGLWLTPMLVAAGAGIPIAWNAPGVSPAIPPWAGALLTTAIGQTTYLSVRDATSAQELRRHTGDAPVHVVPDTAFGAAKLIPEAESEAMQRFRREHALDGAFCVVQPCTGLREVPDQVSRFVAAALERGLTVLELPIGPGVGDRIGMLELPTPTVAPRAWPDPVLLTELIARAEAVVGFSYHLGTIAAACGVPAHRPAAPRGWWWGTRKYEQLESLDTVQVWHPGSDAPPPVFGRQQPATGQGTYLAQLEHHWDRIVSTARHDAVPQIDGLPGRLASLVLQLDDLAAGPERRAAELSEALARSEAGAAEITETLRTTERVLADSRRDLAAMRAAVEHSEERRRALRSRKAVRLSLPVADLLGRAARASLGRARRRSR